MTERQSPPSPDESTQQGPTLEELDARLRKARGEEPSGGGRTGAGAGFGSGLGGAGAMLRIGIEMVSAIAVGVGIGWLLDSWLGTKPWLMVVFFFMGAAAGILGVYRATGRIAYGPGAMPRDTGDATSRGASETTSRDAGETTSRDAGETTSRDAGETTKHKQDAEPSARNDRE